MNLTFLLFSALTCVTSATPETAHIVYDEVEAAFQVNSKVQPDENADNNEFIGQCIASSFNTVHANTEYRLDSIDLESENVGPGTGLSGTHQLAGHFWNFGYRWFATGKCRSCNAFDDRREVAVLTNSFHHWEANFCACLQGSSDPVLQSATDCKINLEELDPVVSWPKKRTVELLNSAKGFHAQLALRGSSQEVT